MAINLVSLAMKFLTPDLMLKMASGLGLDKMLAQKAIAAAVPAIFSGLVGKAAKPDGARSLFDAIGRQDTGLFSNFASMIGASGQSSLVTTGTNALTSMLGGTAVSGLAGAVAKYAGIGEAPAKSLLGMLGPVVMGTIGQEQKSAKLDAGGLATLLAGQKEHIASALPGDFSKLLGATGLLDAVKDQIKTSASAASTTVGSTTSTSARRVETPGRGGTPAHLGGTATPAAPWWRLPLLAAAALGLGWSLFGTTLPPNVTAPTSTTGAQRTVVDSADASNQITGVITQLRTTLGNIRDAGTAQAAVPRLQDAGTQLDRVTALAAKLSPDARRALAGNVSAGLTGLNPLFNTVLALPGVSAVVKPALDGVRAKLDVLSRS